MMRLSFLLLLFLMLAPLVMAQDVFNAPPEPASDAMVRWVNILFSIMVPLMMFMVVLAAAVYAAGQMFGAEMRAKATVWAQNMLGAVGVSAAIIVVLYTLLPWLFTAQAEEINLPQMVEDIRKLTEYALGGMIVVFLVLSAAIYAIGQIFGAETRARASVYATGLLTGAMVAAVLYVLVWQVVPALQTGLENMLASVSGATDIVVYVAIVIEIVLAVAFIILITYLAAKVLKIPEWEAYLNIELSNLMSSFLLVFFIIGFFLVGKEVALSLTQGNYASPPLAAMDFIQEKVATSTLRATIDVYKIQACTSMLSTFSRRVGEFVLTQTYKVFPGIDTFVSITNVLGFSLLMLYNTASVQITLLYLVDALMLPFVMPAGLILRFFPPTKDAGAFLIAVAFGFYVVFPTTYILNQQIYEAIHGGEQYAYYKSPRILIQSLCGPFKFGVAGFLLGPGNPAFSLIPGGGILANTMAKLASETGLNWISMAEFVAIMKHMASLSLLALFIPALSMLVTIAFINSMTKFIVYKV